MQKAGANEVDQVRIKRLSEEGRTAAQISKEVNVEVAVVEKFMPIKKPVMEKKTEAKKE